MSDESTELSELGQAAVWYCEHGFGIIPIEPRGKRPITKSGLHDWFDNPDDARELWTKSPTLNIAIVCGEASGNLTVFDFDENDDKGVHGFDTLSEWEDEFGELATTATAITGSGGMHYLYRDSRSYHPSVNRDLGVDVRSEGSYIVAPPSVHPNGNAYAWNSGDAPWEREIASMGDNERGFLDHVQRNGGMDQDAPQAVLFRLPQRIRSGERNDTIYKYGCSLRGKGYPDDAIDAMLRRANETNCVKPMPEREIASIIQQVCRHGPGHDGQGGFIGEPTGISAPGGSSGSGGSGATEEDVPNFRGPRGSIKHNVLARILIDRNHARLIDGAPAIWTGKRWEFGKNAISKVCIDYADDIKKSVRDEVFAYILSKGKDYSSDKEFDGGFYIQFRNCTYNALTGEVVEPNHSMFITGALTVDLNMDAPYGPADEFLASLANDDEATEKVLGEVIGACMCCRRVLSQSPMLIGRANVASGEASNGKSTFLNVLRALIGTGNVSSLDIATLGQRFQAGRIVGKLANLGDDIPDGFLRGEELAMFKKLVTGDAIYTDVKNSDGYEFRPSASMVFSMNAMPRLADTTDGVFRRLAFVPFRNRFSEDTPGFDPHIAEKMVTDENLQRLALIGLMALPGLIQRGTLTPIPDMVAEVERIRVDNDVVRRWIATELIEAEDIYERWVSEVYDDFKKWCADAGEHIVSQKTFTIRMLDVFGPRHTGHLQIFKTRDRSHGKRGNKFIKG